MKKKNYVSKAVMLGALLAPIGMPTVSVLADSFYQNQTSAHAADITNWIASTPEQITNNLTTTITIFRILILSSQVMSSS